jgi:hypothetical protein
MCFLVKPTYGATSDYELELDITANYAEQTFGIEPASSGLWFNFNQLFMQKGDAKSIKPGSAYKELVYSLDGIYPSPYFDSDDVGKRKQDAKIASIIIRNTTLVTVNVLLHPIFEEYADPLEAWLEEERDADLQAYLARKEAWSNESNVIWGAEELDSPPNLMDVLQLMVTVNTNDNAKPSDILYDGPLKEFENAMATKSDLSDTTERNLKWVDLGKLAPGKTATYEFVITLDGSHADDRYQNLPALLNAFIVANFSGDYPTPTPTPKPTPTHRPEPTTHASPPATIIPEFTSTPFPTSTSEPDVTVPLPTSAPYGTQPPQLFQSVTPTPRFEDSQLEDLWQQYLNDPDKDDLTFEEWLTLIDEENPLGYAEVEKQMPQTGEPPLNVFVMPGIVCCAAGYSFLRSRKVK